MKVWKYILRTTELQTITIPRYHHKLTIQIQNDIPCLWALVDPQDATCEMQIYTVGTGHDLPADWKEYIGTYQTEQFVWHVFTKS